MGASEMETGGLFFGFRFVFPRDAPEMPSDRSPTRSQGSTRAEGTKLPPLRYYNSAVHGAAFVLPEFARAAVEPFVVPGTGFS